MKRSTKRSNPLGAFVGSALLANIHIIIERIARIAIMVKEDITGPERWNSKKSGPKYEDILDISNVIMPI